MVTRLLPAQLLFLAATVALGLMLAPAVRPAAAREPEAEVRAFQSRMTFFYKDPVLADVGPVLDGWAAAMRLPASSVNPMMGFSAGLAAKYPTKLREMFPPSLSSAAQKVAVAGVAMGGPPGAAVALAEAFNWPAEQKAKASTLPRLSGYRIRGPGDLDLLWGAAFATGDPRYPRQILDYFIASLDGADPRDVGRLADLSRKRDTAALRAMRESYGDDARFKALIGPSTALWSLESNARQRAFVRQLTDAYLARFPNGPVAQAWAELRK